MKVAEVSAETVANERYLLCRVAAIVSARQYSPSAEIAKQINSGIRGYLSGNAHSFANQYSLDALDLADTYYTEAADIEAKRDKADENSWSEIDLAFAERLFVLGEDNEARANACFNWSQFVPDALWKAYTKSAYDELQRAGVALVQ